MVFHVLNRGVGRRVLFTKDKDFLAFVGIPVSEHLFAWRTTTTARLTDDAEAMGNDLDPILCTVGPDTAHRRPHAIQLLGRLFPTDLPSPAGPAFRLSATELLPFRERVQGGIGMPGAMAAVARPGILARIGHHRGPHRGEFRCQRGGEFRCQRGEFRCQSIFSRGFNRLVFVGDRGMVTTDNLEAITAGNHGYLVGLKRRRNKKLDKWLAAVDEAKWINCPVGITAREKADPPRTRAQEVPSGIAGMRVIIVDSDERRAYEEAMRVKSMERTRQALEKLQRRIAAGKLKQPEKVGAAAERLLQRSHGYRYYSWEIHQGGFRYFENAAGLGSENGIEGKYVIARDCSKATGANS